ncbi:MAG: hypothetical protein Q8922_13395 [Bacteroidota bacterium]|nr:hypothetical protein [Bacteroidota bacterium]MDP4233871.1 hypothetical protein [Bacteroidota bacterium]MDP4243544.1 hypothetical protein [Bacteroidota bacterium]MDP4288917.1 hypothetical protein [Bacteroidota bacterium]
MDVTQLIPILAALAAASERLVETLKSFLPFLSSPPTKASQAAADPKADRRREGAISLLAILSGIATVCMANQLSIFNSIFPPRTLPPGVNISDFWPTIILGILVAGGSRLWNPLVEWLKAIKDAKKP